MCCSHVHGHVKNPCLRFMEERRGNTFSLENGAQRKMEFPFLLVCTWILLVCAENILYSFIPLDIYGLNTVFSETAPLCLFVYDSPDSIFRDVQYLCLLVQLDLMNMLTISGCCGVYFSRNTSSFCLSFLSSIVLPVFCSFSCCPYQV